MHDDVSRDAAYMSAALALAREGTALASPNPRVGAVLVRDGRVIGQGTHTYEERTHAEVRALEAAGGESNGATLYINLEPCCHQGRTGPCADALIAAGVVRVVAAMPDPNPRVAGEGFRRMRAAGITVDVGLMAAEARRLNEDFCRWVRTGLPFVTMKSALSLDGRIAAASGATASRWITSQPAREKVQLLRHASDSILVGVGTASADDPRLTDRSGLPRRRPLLRIVVDSQLRLSPDSELARSAESDLMVFCCRPDFVRRRALEAAGIRVIEVRAAAGGAGVELGDVLRLLGREQILSVLLEGGGRLNAGMLAGGWVDKLVLFYAPLLFGSEGVPLASGFGPKPLDTGELSAVPVGPDLQIETYLHDVYA